MRLSLVPLFVFAAACSGDSASGTTDTAPDSAQLPDLVDPSDTADTSVAPDTKPSQDTSTDVPEPADTLAPPDVAPDTVVEPDTTVAPDIITPPAAEVRFVVLGDTGEGNERQRKVAAQIKAKCDRDGCDYAFLMGDNIYNAGVESTFDSQWDTKFEEPFAAVDLPFYAVLGNHDNGGFLTQWLGDLFGGAGAEFERGDFQVAYTQYSTKWHMPGRTWDFADGPAHFFGLDTNDMVWSKLNEDAESRTQIQVDSIPGRIDASTATWTVAMGHHPYISNGRHGDAGEYEGLEEDITDLVIPGGWLGDLSGVVTGDGVKESLDDIVCGRVDIYFAGHDHNRQWHAPLPACPGTTFVVSGAGAKLTEFKGDHPALFQDDQKAGFFWVHLKGNELNVEAIDEDGAVNWSHQAYK